MAILKHTKRIEHWSIEDASWGEDEESTRFQRFEETRDDLRQRIDDLVSTL
jgi:L-rhamnose isomerase